MKSYCVKQKKETYCVPGTEQYVKAKNGRSMMKCKCAECGATKTQFVSGQSGGALKRDFACGRNLQGKRPGTLAECLKSGRVRQWGLNQANEVDLEMLLRDRQVERNRKAREKRRARKNTAIVEWRPPAKSIKKPVRVILQPHEIEMLSPIRESKKKKQPRNPASEYAKAFEAIDEIFANVDMEKEEKEMSERFAEQRLKKEIDKTLNNIIKFGSRKETLKRHFLMPQGKNKFKILERDYTPLYDNLTKKR